LLSKQSATDVLGGQNSDSVISRGLSDHSLTESELCPPDLALMSCLKRNNGVLHFISKQFATDVWKDRIPILSKVSVTRKFMTESELCPPGSCVKELIGILHVLIRIKKSPGTRPGLKHL